MSEEGKASEEPGEIAGVDASGAPAEEKSEAPEAPKQVEAPGIEIPISPLVGEKSEKLKKHQAPSDALPPQKKAVLGAKKFSEKNPGQPVYVSEKGGEFKIDMSIPDSESFLMLIDGKAFHVSAAEV